MNKTSLSDFVKRYRYEPDANDLRDTAEELYTIAAYRLPSSRDRSFALAAGFRRIDEDERPISEIPEHELLDGFGA